MDPCAICGFPRTEGAHVKPRNSFPEALRDGRHDRSRNIIPLCPTHHSQFDLDHTIGILPDKTGFVVLIEGIVELKPSLVDIRFLHDDLITERNESCTRAVKLALGIFPGYATRKIWKKSEYRFA